MSIISRRVKSTFLQVVDLVDLTTFKVGVKSDYIGTGDSHNPTSSQSHLGGKHAPSLYRLSIDTESGVIE